MKNVFILALILLAGSFLVQEHYAVTPDGQAVVQSGCDVLVVPAFSIQDVTMQDQRSFIALKLTKAPRATVIEQPLRNASLAVVDSGGVDLAYCIHANDVGLSFKIAEANINNTVKSPLLSLGNQWYIDKTSFT